MGSSSNPTSSVVEFMSGSSLGMSSLVFYKLVTRYDTVNSDCFTSIVCKNTITLGPKVHKGPLHAHFFVDKISTSSILALFRQNRNSGNSAQIKNKLSYIIPMTNLAKYETNRRTWKISLTYLIKPYQIMLKNLYAISHRA